MKLQFALVGLFFIASFSLSCEKHSAADFSADPEAEEFFRISAKRMCEKMIECYRPIYRTVSPDLRKQINVENCTELALTQLKENAHLHTSGLKFLASSCYNELLNTSCDDFARKAFWSPACFQLRKKSAELAGRRVKQKNGSSR